MKRNALRLTLPACCCLSLVASSPAWTQPTGDDGGRASVLVSPDGRLLAYGIPAYDEDGTRVTRVVVCALDGSESRVVGTVPGQGGALLWLGNHRLVSPGNEATRYSVIALTGQALPDIVLPEGCDPQYARFSPAGDKVAYVGSLRPAGAERQNGVFIADLAAGTVKLVLEGGLKTAPAWSPDGRTLAIGNAAGYAAHYPLVLVDAETGRMTDTNVEGVGAEWSPDGKSVACTTAVSRGGSWRQGVPDDGRLGVLDLTTGRLTCITPEPKHGPLLGPPGEQVPGALNPVWSRDSQRIAYVGVAGDTNELWVVGRAGGDARKLRDTVPSPLAWAPDGRSLFGIHDVERQLVKIDVGTGGTQVLASWDKPEAPVVKPTVIEAPGVTVTLTRVPEEYGRALVSILTEARREYEQTLGLKLPDTIRFDAVIDPEGSTRLWTDGQSCVYLTLTSKSQLGPPGSGAPHNVYGACHELGHIVMYSGLKSLMGLPAGVGEGWAHYAGSVVVDEVAGRLGDTIWPQPFDVRTEEGLGRLSRQTDGKEWDALDATTAAAKTFYEVEKRHGRATVGQAMARALDRSDRGLELMPAFVAALRELTGDQKAGDWIPETVLKPTVEWNVKERELPAGFFDGLKPVPDETGTWLVYDDDKADGKRSIAGSGYAVLLERPEGEWTIDRVSVFGERYGAPEPPDEDFLIHICDEQFQPIAEIARPYSTFELGEGGWHDIAFDPVAAPTRFYVCVSFNPTATKGVYVYYDSDVGRSHSRVALPYSHVADVQGTFDWMIRAHLAPANRE